MDVKERFKLIRRLSKLSQAEFGKKINLAQNTISSLENGSLKLTERVIVDVCREFKINKEWLIDGKDPMYYNDDLSSFDEDIQLLTKNILSLGKENREIIISMIDMLKNKEKKS